MYERNMNANPSSLLWNMNKQQRGGFHSLKSKSVHGVGVGWVSAVQRSRPPTGKTKKYNDPVVLGDQYHRCDCNYLFVLTPSR